MTTLHNLRADYGYMMHSLDVIYLFCEANWMMLRQPALLLKFPYLFKVKLILWCNVRESYEPSAV